MSPWNPKTVSTKTAEIARRLARDMFFIAGSSRWVVA
jgi:hypothetical protein